MNTKRFQRPSSISSQGVYRYEQKTNYNSQNNDYSNKKFSQRKNKFNSYEKNSFSNKFSTDVLVTKPKETLVEKFPSLSSKTSTKPVVKPVVKPSEQKQVDIKKNNNPWGKKNVIQHIKNCYKKQDDKKNLEADKRQKIITEANKRQIQQNNNVLVYKYNNNFQKNYYYNSENDEYQTDNNNNNNNNYDYDDEEEYMGWSSE